jgi:protein arginine kinase activator
MLCQICRKNDATVHLTEIEDGQRSELHVCELCAQEQGISVKGQIPLNELLSGLLASQPADDELFGSAGRMCCPHCGLTLDQFRKKGVLGCPRDYEVFEDTLLPLIERAHDFSTAHCGKVPSKAPKEAKKDRRLAGLQRRLDEAVRAEDYEQAARLRDQIEKLS